MGRKVHAGSPRTGIGLLATYKNRLLTQSVIRYFKCMYAQAVKYVHMDKMSRISWTWPSETLAQH